jgi:uncharacterized hydrophobic protein (TIGR00271 family)
VEEQGTKQPVRKASFFGKSLLSLMINSDHPSQKLGKWAYDELREASIPDREFFILITLSTIIAAAGLLANSVAVIIGAMLIAPLMSPILGVGLAVAHGDRNFLTVAVLAVLRGAILGVAIAAVVTWVLPHPFFGNEVLARTKPSLLDLTVALASGIAGAYTYSSKELSAALPGVAIAAALVPPLSVVGIGIAYLQPEIFIGASLLFLANFIAIALGAALTFIFLGFTSRVVDEQNKFRRRRGIIAALILLLIIAIPMFFFTVQSIADFNDKRTVESLVNRYFPPEEGYVIARSDVSKQAGRLQVQVIMYGEKPPLEERIEFLNYMIGRRLSVPVSTSVTFTPSVKFRIEN